MKRNLPSLLLPLLFPLAAMATEKPIKAQPIQAPVSAPAPLTASQALAPLAPAPVAPASPSLPAAPAFSPTIAAPVAVEASTAATKVAVKREGFFKRKFKQMRERLNTYVLVGLILVGIGILVAAVASGLLGALFIIGGGVLIILGVI